jgi:DNA-binding NarL/FixJ family response regulator
MIRFTIQRKVFIASFLLVTAMTALLLGLTRWNLQQGFGHYIVETEIGQLDWLVKNIEDAYAQSGSWAFVPQTDPGWRIQGDAQRLEQVFTNLLENTLRYTNPGGRLQIAASASAGRLHLQFDDTAPAPPEYAMHRLFERFFRGLSILREVRKVSDLPVILVTARVDEIDRLIGLELGADDYVCKPYSPREVLARAKAVLRRTTRRVQTPTPDPAAAPLIEIDSEGWQATVKGQRLALTPRNSNCCAS